MNFKCPQCGTSLKLSPEILGRKVQCPSCRHTFDIPPDFQETKGDSTFSSLAQGQTESRRPQKKRPEEEGFRVVCPFCKTTLKTQREHRGKQAQCASCQTQFAIPFEADAEIEERQANSDTSDPETTIPDKNSSDENLGNEATANQTLPSGPRGNSMIPPLSSNIEGEDNKATTSAPDLGKNSSPLNREYWCFISYRHDDNKEEGREWAGWLHQQIETYEVPDDLVGSLNEVGEKIPSRIFPVFRDKEELRAGNNLTERIYSALDNSRALLVICSPRVIESKYVDAEIRYFKKIGKEDAVFAAIIDGDPFASSIENGKCFPEALQFELDQNGEINYDRAAEPLAADFRFIDGLQGWTSPEIFRQSLIREGLFSKKQITEKVAIYLDRLDQAKLMLISGLLRVPLGILQERDKAYQLKLAKRRSRNLRLWLSAVASTLFLAVVAGLVAREQAHQAFKAEGRALEGVREAAEKAWGAAKQAFSDEKDPGIGFARLSEAVRYNRKLPSRLKLSALNQYVAMRVSYTPFLDPIPDLVFKVTGVEDARFSPDGKSFITADSNGNVTVWDSKSGEQKGMAFSHGKPIKKAKYSPNGQLVVAVPRGGSSSIWLWNVERQQPHCPPLEHNAIVTDAQFSPDSTVVATIDLDNNVTIWSVSTGKPLAKPLAHESRIQCPEFSPDGSLLATASDEGFAQIWNTHTGDLISSLAHDGGVNCVQFHPRRDLVVTSSFPDATQIWDYEAEEPIADPFENRQAYGAKFSPDGTRLLTIFGVRPGPLHSRPLAMDDDYYAQIWDVDTGKPIGEPLRHRQEVYDAFFSPDGGRVLTIGSDFSVKIWDSLSGYEIGKPLRHEATVLTACFGPDSKHVLTVSEDGNVQIWTPAMNVAAAEPFPHETEVRTAEFDPEGNFIVTSSEDQYVRIWGVEDGNQAQEPIWHSSEICSAQFSGDGTKIFSCCVDGKVQVWDIENRKKIGSILTLPHESDIYSARFNSDGSRVATVTEGNKARLWDLGSGTLIKQLRHQDSKIYSSSFSPDGNQIVTAGEDGTARIWEGKATGRIFQHDTRVVSAEFGHDGSKILTSTGGDDGAIIRIWDVETGKIERELLTDSRPIIHARFSSDGRHIITLDENGLAQNWEVASGAMIWDSYEQIQSPCRHPTRLGECACHQFNSAHFNSQGDRIVTAGRDGNARIWHLPLKDEFKIDPIELERFGGFRVDESGVIVPVAASERAAIRNKLVSLTNPSKMQNLFCRRLERQHDRRCGEYWLNAISRNPQFPSSSQWEATEAIYDSDPGDPLMPFIFAIRALYAQNFVGERSSEGVELHQRFLLDLGLEKITNVPSRYDALTSLRIQWLVIGMLANADEISSYIELTTKKFTGKALSSALKDVAKTLSYLGWEEDTNLVWKELLTIDEPMPEHLADAGYYASIYGDQTAILFFEKAEIITKTLESRFHVQLMKGWGFLNLESPKVAYEALKDAQSIAESLKIKSHKVRSELLAGLAASSYSFGKVDESIEYYRELIELHSDWAYGSLAVISYRPCVEIPSSYTRQPTLERPKIESDLLEAAWEATLSKYPELDPSKE